jgi:hypothetical protein
MDINAYAQVQQEIDAVRGAKDPNGRKFIKHERCGNLVDAREAKAEVLVPLYVLFKSLQPELALPNMTAGARSDVATSTVGVLRFSRTRAGGGP